MTSYSEPVLVGARGFTEIMLLAAGGWRSACGDAYMLGVVNDAPVR